MLDIINGKVVAITGEGTFELTDIDIHRAITTSLIELMEDTNTSHIRDNYKEAQRLYTIGEKVYRSEYITETETKEDLMPLVDCVVSDTAERHLAALVMRYVIREYLYKIRTRHELNSLYDFFFIMRDPVYTLVLKDKPEFDLYYRIAAVFYEELGEYDKHLNELEDASISDIIEAHNDDYAFKMAIKNNTELPKLKKEKPFAYITSEIVKIPARIASLGFRLQYDEHIFTQEDLEYFHAYYKMQEDVYVKHAYGDYYGSDNNYSKFKKGRIPHKQIYAIAKRMGAYNVCYYIAQVIGSDAKRRSIAKLSGVETPVYSLGISFRRTTIRFAKTALILAAMFIGYKVLKGIYDFIEMPFIFWTLFIAVLGGALSTPESREASVMFTTHSAYRRVRLEQSQEEIRQLRQLSSELRSYNNSLANNNGYRYFKR